MKRTLSIYTFTRAIKNCLYQIALISIPLGLTSGPEAESVNLKNYSNYDLSFRYPDSALDLSLQLLAELPPESPPLTRSNVLTVIGSIYQELQEYDKALEYLLEAYRIREKSGKTERIAVAEYNIGNAFYAAGQYNKALPYYQLSKQKLVSLEDSSKIVAVYSSMATCSDALMRQDSASYYFQRALKYVNDSTRNQSFVAIDLYSNLAKVYLEGSLLDSAQYYLEQILSHKKIKEDPFLKTKTLHQFGILWEYRLELTKAEAYYDSAFQILQSIDDLEQLVNVERSKLNIRLIKSRDSAALNLLNSYIDNIGKLNQRIRNDNINRLETEYQVEKKEIALSNSVALNTERQKRIYLLLVLLLLISLLSFLLIRFYRNRKRLSDLQYSLKNRELEDLLREQEIERVNALLKGQNKERQRIAQELHDRLGSLLLAAKLQYQKLERNLQKALEDQYKAQGQLDELLQEATEEVRRISHDLYEGSLAQFGFSVAINQLIDAVEAANDISITFSNENVPIDRYKEFEQDLYRICQELLSNSLKYANAQNIEIKFSILEEQFIFDYRDDGQGFDININSENPGIGLKNIYDRARRIGAELQLNSMPGEGMHLKLSHIASHGGNKDHFSGRS